MEEEHSKLWRLALILSLMAFAAAAYFKIPPFRSLVDEKCPWVKEQLVAHDIRLVDQGPNREMVSDDTPLDFDQIAADRTLWPKDLTLKQYTVFPTVYQGREVGKITVPAGGIVQLYRIENQKLGVVFKGGGAWVKVEETDLMERVANRRTAQ